MSLEGLVVLDVDPKNGGHESLRVLEAEYAPLPQEARQRSGSGGWHYLMRLPDEGQVGIRRGFRPGLDLLTGPGCYIVAEPSVHVSGGFYAWTDEPCPLTTTRNTVVLNPPPQWLLGVADDKGGPAKAGPQNRVPVARILSDAVDKVKAGEPRNNTGLWVFTQLRDNGYSRDEAILAVREWVARANDSMPGQDRYTKTEADATLRQAYSREAREPWGAGEKDSQADKLLALAADFEHFKSGPANDAFVRVPMGDHREVWQVDSRSPRVREILTHRYFIQEGRAPSREALNTAVDTILARCGAGPKVEVHVRFARAIDAIYLDMADERWRAIQITKDGWAILDNPPVLFRRPCGARALPVPVQGGSLDALRAMLNPADESEFCLMLAWLVGVFQPEGAFTHLVLEGEQGSAKTTTARILHGFLDPSDAGLSSPPKDESDATIAAMHAGILAFDNLSGCRAELSDTLCRFSTGQGYKTRTLYETLGLTVVALRVPVLLNGIDATVMRPDLMERSIMLRLPRIAPETRRTEQGIWEEFARIHPECLGALLDAVSMGLRNLSGTRVPNPPRMADFCTWVSACEPALPWERGSFMRAYLRKLEDANRELADGDSVAAALVDWATNNVTPGCGMETSSKDLLVDLNEATQGMPKDLRHWPQSPESLAHRLVRLAPVLRAHGIEVTKLPRSKTARSRWRVWRDGPQWVLGFASE